LTYHDIEDYPTTPFAVTPSQFRQHMQYLKDNFDVLSLDEILLFIEGKLIVKNNSIAITFDDGYKSMYKYAYPILKQMKIPAAFFIITDCLRKGINRYEQKELLSKDEILEMQKAGFIFGSHSKDHARLNTLNIVDLKKNVEDSKKVLEDTLGETVRFFAYPFGQQRHYNNTVKTIVESAGFSAAFTSINGAVSLADDRFSLKRTKIEGGDSFYTFQNILKGGLDIWSVIDCFPI
jgi:peptidoglycan/xylan/chitin deacetylase (PgdA/CDA1 family)